MAFNSQLYAKARPDLANNWQNAQNGDPNDPIVQFIKQFGSFDAYLANDFSNNPNAEQQQAAAAAQNTGNGIQQAQSNQAALANTQVNTNNAPGSGNGFSNLVTGNQPGPSTPTPATAAPTNVTGGNYNQSQTGAQSGAFSTTNTSGTSTNQVTMSNLVDLVNSVMNQQQKTGSTNVGTTQNTGTNSNSGTTTNFGGGTTNTSSKPVDTLGFGSLLQQQAPGVVASDAARSGFLVDTMQNGGTGFMSQVDKGVRQSLSGPGMSGVGESAQARAAGYAASDIARNNLGERLNAAAQLSGPTGLATLASAGNPYIGQQGSSVNTGSNTTNTNNTGVNTNIGSSSNIGTGFADLTGSSTNTKQSTGVTSMAGNSNTQDSSTGTAGSSSASNAAGNIPQAQQVQTGGGGCIVCTVGIHHGLFRNRRVLRRVVRHKLQVDHTRFRRAARGYFFLFTPFARALLTRPRLARLAMPYARAVVYEELRISGRGLPFEAGPWLAHWSWHGVCSVAGWFVKNDHLTDPALVATAKKYNVFFNLSGGK